MSAVAKIVRMTPEVAGKLIEARNGHNRNVTWGRVTQYAEDIRRGEWLMNGEAIKIAKDGTVLDGQHRLMAILEADRPIETLLVTGLDPTAQESMDQGKPRGFNDVLRLRGEKDYNVLAAAVKLIATYERDGVPFARGFASAVSNQQASLTLARNPEIRDACKLATRLRKPWMPVSNMGALYFLMSAAEEGRAAAFFTQLGEGVELAGPVHTLRDRLICEHAISDGTRMHLKVRMVFVVIGWNAFVEGHSLPDLRWAMNDPFPGISGLSAPDDGLWERAA
jgi:hypothetical protein